MSKSRKHKEPSKALPNIQRTRSLIPGIGLIVFLTVLAYIPAMRAGFVWDDNIYVTQNPLLTAPDGLAKIWFSLNSPSQYFPLVYTSFRVEHAIWGLNPIGYHVINILLHAANAVLLWWILRRLKVPGAWLAAAIWALHPVNVESVAWITERKNTLSTLFYMLSVLAWMHSIEESGERKWIYYGLSLGATMLALFAKTTACTIPAALLVVLWLKHERIDLKRLAQIVPFGVLGVAMGLVSIWWEKNHQGTLGATFAFTLPERFIIAGHALWFYLGKVFLPVKLTFSYPQWKLDAAAPLQYLWLLAAISGIVALWIYRKKIGSGPLVGTAFFAATLAPLLGFISLYTFRYTFVADHYQYVACIGPIVLLSAFIYKRWESQYVRAGISAAILLVLGILTWVQCGIYRDMETLWRDTAAKNPSAWIAHNNLSGILIGRGEFTEAAAECRETLRYNPKCATAHGNLGIILSHEGKLDEALKEHAAALRLDPRSAMGHLNYAISLAKRSRVNEAIAECEAALRIWPGYPAAYSTLGNIKMQTGKYDEAAKDFDTVLSAEPGNMDALCNLSLALSKLGKTDEAIEGFRQVVQLQPQMVKAHQYLARALYVQGDYAEAWKEVHLCEEYGSPVPELAKTLSAKMPDPGR